MKICYHNGDLILLEKYIKIRLYHKNSIINGFFFKRNSIPLLRMHQTLIFRQDVAKSNDARRVREP